MSYVRYLRPAASSPRLLSFSRFYFVISIVRLISIMYASEQGALPDGGETAIKF